MSQHANRVFISYRRDDAAGYAGRLEEALERRLGHGSVFRDVIDITPGADFVAAIRARLAGAQTVLVLIGPRWAGEGAVGQRRIDDPGDFVRLEVAMALDSGVRVLPVLLPGAEMPSEADLPEPLKPLARRHALTLGDTHWQADMARLIQALGLRPRRSFWPWALAGALLAAAAVAALYAFKPWQPTKAPTDHTARLLGIWEADVRYSWGDAYRERFEFKRHAGQVTGSASFLGYPRAIEQLRVDGTNLHFETRTLQSMGSETREVTHRYSAELRGPATDERLALRMVSSGAFDITRPLEFEAQRTSAAASAAAR
jgi:hypothetical protein